MWFLLNLLQKLGNFFFLLFKTKGHNEIRREKFFFRKGDRSIQTFEIFDEVQLNYDCFECKQTTQLMVNWMPFLKIGQQA